MDRLAGATAAEVARRRFGGPTQLLDRVVTVNATVTQLVPNNPRRVFWVAVNRSVNSGAVGFDRSVTFANGFLVGAAGGVIELDVDVDGEGVAWEAWAINDAAAGTWRVLEVVRV